MTLRSQKDQKYCINRNSQIKEPQRYAIYSFFSLFDLSTMKILNLKMFGDFFSLFPKWKWNE